MSAAAASESVVSAAGAQAARLEQAGELGELWRKSGITTAVVYDVTHGCI